MNGKLAYGSACSVNHGGRNLRRANRFTMIELLVVIAIIGILVSILLPALKTAKDLSKISACGSNLHQVGTAQSMYMSDFNEWLMPAVMGQAGGNYIAYASSGPLVYGRLGLLIDQNYINRNLLNCPGREQTSAGYWYNRACTYSYFIPGDDYNWKTYNLNQIQKNLFTVAARNPAVLWKANVGCAVASTASSGISDSPPFNTPHASKGTNVLRLDGSVWFLNRLPLGWPAANTSPGVSGPTYHNITDKMGYWRLANERTDY